jgi:hypothetical protein
MFKENFSNDEKLTSDREELDRDKLLTFISKLKESLFRIEVIKKILVDFQKKEEVQFLNLFLSPPQSLLMELIRKQKWDDCDSLLSFFNMSQRDKDIAFHAKRFHLLVTKLSVSSHFELVINFK